MSRPHRRARRPRLEVLEGRIVLSTTSTGSALVPSVQVSENDPAGVPRAGDILSYFVTVVNNGPDTATGLTVVATLPADAAFIGSGEPTPGPVAGVLTLLDGNSIGNSHPSGDSAYFDFRLKATSAGPFTVTIQAKGDQTDPDPAGSVITSTADISAIPPSPDLVLTGSLAGTPALGQWLIDSQAVTNQGTADATDATLTETIPEGLEVTSLPAGATLSGTTLTVHLGTIAAYGGHAAFNLDLKPTAVGSFSVHATATSDESGPNSGKNTRAISVTVPNTLIASPLHTAYSLPVSLSFSLPSEPRYIYGAEYELIGAVPIPETGTVTYLDGTTVLATEPTYTSFTAVDLPAGTHVFTASYTGSLDGTYAPAQSAPVVVTVDPTYTTTTLASSGTGASPFGAPVTLTADVAGIPTPAGNVTFLDGSTVIGSAAVDASGTASFDTSTLAVGAHAILARFTGADALLSNSNVLNLSVFPSATTTTLGLSARDAPVGSPITLAADVAGPTGGPTPTGTITFLDGYTPLGTAPLDAYGRATLATVAPIGGPHSITAAYSGDGRFNPSTSTVTPLTTSPAASDGPTVLGFVRSGIHRRPTQLILTFSGPLDPASAEDLANYRLNGPGNPRRVIPITSAAYDATSDTVTLTPSRRLDVRPRFQYRLTVFGATPQGLRGASGLALDGAGTGRPGSDFATIFRSFGPGDFARLAARK